MIKANGYLYVSYYCQDGRLRYPTGVKVGSKSKGDKIKLDRIEKSVDQYVTNCSILEQPVLKGELWAYLDEQLQKTKRTAADFISDWNHMVSDMRDGKLLKADGNQYSPKSADNYENVLIALKEHAPVVGIKLSYGFSIEDYRRLLQHLIGMNYSRNHIANIVGKLASFLRKMNDVGKHKNDVYKHKEFRYAPEESDTVALSIEELTALYNLPLTGAQERARDVFVFGCWVALRAEDLARINLYKKRGDVFEVLTRKTGEKVVIPVHWMADAIYTKYSGHLPVYSTPEGLGYHLPTICKLAGITEQRLVSITKGGRRVAEHYKKSDLISVHTARRTFATIMYKQGFPTKAIMKITGHRTERAFLGYIRIDKEEAADLMLKSDFFKKTS